MQPPKIPQCEPERLSALKSLNILDTPAEDRFDHVTSVAARLFDVPIALVSLVDENRQWFKSRVGLDATETPRDISFCGHAILEDDTLVIPNALNDPRFSDNPLVTDDPSIRFYAGYPLSASDGQKIGTLCIIDSKPRDFGTDDLAMLKNLGKIIESEFDSAQMATQDPLTKVLNRRGFMQIAEQSLHLCRRNKVTASLVFLDINKFKPINDTYGHAEGDRALVMLAEKLNLHCRSMDIVARLGGDEFVILLLDTSPTQAEAVMQRIDDSVRQGVDELGVEYKVTFSHGVVEFNHDKHESIAALVQEADSIMYENKKAGYV